MLTAGISCPSGQLWEARVAIPCAPSGQACAAISRDGGACRQPSAALFGFCCASRSLCAVRWPSVYTHTQTYLRLRTSQYEYGCSLSSEGSSFTRDTPCPCNMEKDSRKPSALADRRKMFEQPATQQEATPPRETSPAWCRRDTQVSGRDGAGPPRAREDQQQD